jgi:ethanolaminephosphotransferase
MAPNLITLIGLMVNISGVFVIMYYDSTLSYDLPRWVHFYTAFCVFAYQTFDAIDGKQARRTGSSSPLGQLFDHGCDAFSSTTMGIMMSQAIRGGSTFVSSILFYQVLV